MVEDWLKTIDAYPHWTEDTLRFGDSDLLGHINTASYVTYCDTARLIFCTELGLIGPELDTAAMVVRTSIDLMKELFPPGRIDIGTGLARIGRTSFTLTQGLFHRGTCVAVAETVLVCFSRATRRPVVPGEDVVERAVALTLRRLAPPD